MKKSKSLYYGHRFPAEVISCAVRWYFRFQLSLRDIEELLFERGVIVTYETIRCWCDKFGKGFARRVKAARPGSTWHLDEMFVALRGEPYLLWRAVDEQGTELEVLVQKRRDKAAAKRFVKRVLRSNPVPSKIVTDQLRSYPAARAAIPKLGNVKHVFVKAAARLNNRAENSHHTDTRPRATHARFSRPGTHTKIPLMLRADTATFRTQARSVAHVSLSQTTRSPVRGVAQIYQHHPKSVYWFLTSTRSRPRAVPCSASWTMPSQSIDSQISPIGKYFIKKITFFTDFTEFQACPAVNGRSTFRLYSGSNKMKALSVSSRLAVGFGLVLALLVIVSALGFYSEKTLYINLDNIARVNNTEARLANALKSTVRDRAIAIRNVGLLTDESQIAQQVARLAAQDKAYQDAYDRLGQIFAHESSTTKQENTLFAQLKIDEDATTPLWAKAITLAQANDKAGVTEVLIKQAWQKTSGWISRLDELANLEDDLSEKAAAQAASTYAAINTVTWAVIGLAMAIGIVAAILITRSIVRQLGGEPADAQAVAREIAGGNLMVEMKLADGDANSLMASLESMRKNLSEIVTGIQISAESISVAAGEIAQGNVDLSQRTEEQAASLEETAASMEELTSTVRQNTDNARQGSTLAATASQTAAAGGEAVQKVVATMENISASSTRVAEIISVIESIAFQTNILALNAAVEAARAGEQGRGFAVVAGEVRTLAQRSATAAKEIKDLISASVGHVSAGSRLVHEAGNTMNDVVRSVQRVTDIIGEVASASTEQSTGIEQVNVAVNQMDEVTQQNAALVEQASAAAQAMAEQAQSLRNAVAIFQVEPRNSITQTLAVQTPSAIRKITYKKALRFVSAQ